MYSGTNWESVFLPNDEILKLKELVNVDEETVSMMYQDNQIPTFNVRGQWHFRRADIHMWIDQQAEKDAAGWGPDE